MRTIAIELRKEKRTGIILLMPMAGILGAAYAFTFFLVQKDTLFNLPLPPMDVLLTQAYGMIMVLNMFGIIAAACMIYNMEFKESAMKKMYALPVSVPAMFFCKFLILTIMLLTAICFQNSTLTNIGLAYLPQGTFAFKTLLAFAGYSYITSMPVLSFIVPVTRYVGYSRYRCCRFFKRHGIDGVKGALALHTPFCNDAKTRCCHERTAGYGCCYFLTDRNSVFPFCGIVGCQNKTLRIRRLRHEFFRITQNRIHKGEA